MQLKISSAFSVLGRTRQRLASLMPALLVLCLWQGDAQAACSRAAINIVPQAPAPTLTFDTTTPLGTVIGRTTIVTLPANTVLGNCTGGSGAMYITGTPDGGYALIAPGATEENQRAVHDVNNKVIPGLAMVLYVTYNGTRYAMSRDNRAGDAEVYTVKCNRCSSISSSASGLKIEAEFIKTQHSLQTVNMPQRTVALLQFDATPPGNNLNYYPFSMAGSNTKAKASCRVNFPGTIQLGTISKNILVHDGGSPDQRVRITFACDVAPKLTMRISQAAGAAADSKRGILSNTDTSSSAARGVGVQIRADDVARTPVELGQDQDSGLQSSASFNRDFYARMVPLSTLSPTSGSVRAQAAITATFD